MSQQPYGAPAGWPAGSPGGSAQPPPAAGYVASPSGYSQPSGGFGAGHGQPPSPAGPGGPAKARAGAAAWVLGVLAVLLLVGVGVLASSASGSLADQRKQISTLESQSAADASSDAASAAAVPTVDTAALQAKYKAVKDADAAVAGAIQKWNSESSTKFGVVIDALQLCYRKVDDYDRAMAPVPASLRGSLPAKVDLNNPQTDCSRSSLKRL